MPIEKVFTFVCFSLWALATMFVLVTVIVKPHLARLGASRRLEASNPFDIAMMIAVGAWLAMWCFRSMY